MTEDQREKLFDGFWASADFNTQNAYICGCIKVVEIKRTCTCRYTAKETGSRRSNSRVYYVNNGSGISVRVGRKAFLRMHDLSAGRVNRALKAHCVAGGSPHMDSRGCHEPANKTCEDDISFVKEHIMYLASLNTSLTTFAVTTPIVRI